MAHFNWTDVNLIGDTLWDPMNAITGMLVDMGHTVSKGGLMVETAPSINLMFEGFAIDTIYWMRAMKKLGCQFVIVCSERFGQDSLNDSPDPDMKLRQIWLRAAAAEAIDCWALVPGTAKILKNYAPQAHDIELGYSEARAKALLRNEVRLYDYAFFGSSGGRRHLMMRAMKEGGATIRMPRDYLTDDEKKALDDKVEKFKVYGPNDFPELAIRNRCIAESRLTIGLKPFKYWPLCSSARINASLIVGTGVLMEEIDDQECTTPWREVVPFVPIQEFYPRAEAMKADYLNVADEQIARFKTLMSPERAIGAALRDTLAVANG